MSDEEHDLPQDDFGGDEFDDDLNFEDFESGEGSLGEVARSPLVKIGIVVAGLATIVAGLILFGGGDGSPSGSTAPSRIVASQKAQGVKQPPGQEDVSPEYRGAVETENIRRTRTAIQEGGSAIPTPVDKPPGKLPLLNQQSGQEDPLQRWRRIQKERQEQQAQQEAENNQSNTLPSITGDFGQNAQTQQSETISALAEAMSAQMGSILESRRVSGIQVMKVTSPDRYDNEQQGDEIDISGNNSTNPDGVNEVEIIDILLPAGTIEYAQLMTEANSDTPSPIMAQVVSGPLSGSRLLGSFETMQDLLVLNFNSIVVDGIVHPTQALALDPDTASAGMATDIDRRYFRRIVLPAAAAFIEGLGEAVSDSGSTNVSIEGDTVIEEDEELDTEQEIFKGLEEAASKAGEVLDDEGSNVNPLIRVRAGTPMALLFVSPVTDEQSVQ